MLICLFSSSFSDRFILFVYWPSPEMLGIANIPQTIKTFNIIFAYFMFLAKTDISQR
jgi:hypothetical protein